ncbi:MAG: dethiobiotin synthase [Bacteroidota bacterium]|nr:dethiobiotin synthase [Bacteroidota bacterium]MDP4212225.1 dethiobiotin synthase [Bacteroidota bacterium]MDP4251747.1 dethiobiotin synthase [Bacteroidota bacterium]
MQPLFISGIGTGIGKTFVSAVLTEILQADYWKPVQAGIEEGTDKQTVRSLISNTQTIIHPEIYLLKLPASPHIAARQENIRISTGRIADAFDAMKTDRPMIVEGAGGLMVPLNESEFVIDLVKKMNAKLILVSRNYLGSINHSLLTAEICRNRGVQVAGWVFNDQFMDYESEIVSWTGFPALFSIPFLKNISRESVSGEASIHGDKIRSLFLESPAHPGE